MTKTELNFNDLPSELKRLIFDNNHQAAKDQRYRQNKEMMLTELRYMTDTEDFKEDPYPSVVNQVIRHYEDYDYEYRVFMYDLYANDKVLEWPDFCEHYLITSQRGLGEGWTLRESRGMIIREATMQMEKFNGEVEATIKAFPLPLPPALCFALK